MTYTKYEAPSTGLRREPRRGRSGLSTGGSEQARDVSREAPIRVLICDDHAVLAQGLAAVLETKPDIEVVGVANSVADVLEKAGRHHPEVVLMDYELPDGDGVGAIGALKEAYPETKVVMLTSFTDDTILIGAIEAGCSGYITKHDGADVLADGVRRAASGEALVSAAMLSRLLPALSKTKRDLGWDLTARELEILTLLAEGISTKRIAEMLYLSSNTIRNHAQNILMKLGVHSRLEAVAVGIREGLIHRS